MGLHLAGLVHLPLKFLDFYYMRLLLCVILYYC